MSLTTPQPANFLPKQLLTDQQLHNSVEMYARNKAGWKAKVGDEKTGHTSSYLAFVEDFRRVKLLADFVNAKVDGMTTYVKETLVPNLNLAYDQIETEVGHERLSNSKCNLAVNTGFQYWNAGVTNPLVWTAAGAPTVTRVAARSLPPVSAFGTNYGAQIASGGAAGSLSQTVTIKGGSIFRLAGWIKLNSTASVTISLTDNGATPTVQSFTVTDTQVGAAAWFSFPRLNFDQLGILTAADATTLTIKLSVPANKTAAFSDIQLVQGPNADADLWTKALEDITSAPGLLPGGPVNFVDNEVPAGVIDGANTVFTLATVPNPQSSLHLYKNGLRMKAGGVDFTLAGLTIQFNVAPPLNSILLADYRY